MSLVRSSVRRSVRPSIRPSTKGHGFEYPLQNNLVLHAPLTQSINALVGTSPTFTRESEKMSFVPDTNLVTLVDADIGAFEGGGLSIEPEVTNEATGDISSWLPAHNALIEADGTIGPDGSAPALKFTATEGESLAFCLIPGNALSGGFWVKAGSVRDVVVGALAGDFSIVGMASVECSADGEWTYVKFTISGTPAAVVIGTGDVSSQNEGDSCYFCFPQAHNKPYCGTPILTLDLPATRAQDKLTVLNANCPDPDEAHTIAFDLIVHSLAATADIFEGISETPQRKLSIGTNGSISVSYGATVITSSAGVIEAGRGYRIVIACSGTQFALYVSGVLINSDAVDTGSTGGNLVFGEAGNAFFTMSNLKIYNAQASASQVPFV